jgi:hypothetical protein
MPRCVQRGCTLPDISIRLRVCIVGNKKILVTPVTYALPSQSTAIPLPRFSAAIDRPVSPPKYVEYSSAFPAALSFDRFRRDTVWRDPTTRDSFTASRSALLAIPPILCVVLVPWGWLVAFPPDLPIA